MRVPVVIVLFAVFVDIAHAETSTSSLEALTATQRFLQRVSMGADDRARGSLGEALATKGGGKCMSLVGKMCAPCPQGGDPKLCKDAMDECKRIFCAPLCRRITWSCSVTFGKFKEEAANSQFEQSLCSQFLGQGCQAIMDCCQEDGAFYEYIDDNAFFDQFPNPRFPSPNCLEQTDENCKLCKANVKVKLEAGTCPFPTLTGAKAKAKQSPNTFIEELSRSAPKRKVGGILSARSRPRARADETVLLAESTPHRGTHQQRELQRAIAASTRMPATSTNSRLSPYEIQHWMERDQAWQDKYDKFIQTTFSGPGGAEKGGATSGPKAPCGMGPGGFPGCPAHTSIQERCEALLKKVKPKLPSMESQFKARVCSCMGCCKGGCYYPVQEEFPPGGENPPSSQG